MCHGSTGALHAWLAFTLGTGTFGHIAKLWPVLVCNLSLFFTFGAKSKWMFINYVTPDNVHGVLFISPMILIHFSPVTALTI